MELYPAFTSQPEKTGEDTRGGLMVESVRKLESIRAFDSEAWRVSTAFVVMNARPFQKRQVPSPAYILITDGGANNYENVPEPNVLFPWSGHASNHNLLALSQQRVYGLANSTDLICEPYESPFFSASKRSVYKYDQVVPPSDLEPFRDGFYKSTCFPNPTDGEPPEEYYCIFINPTINHGQGMVIVTPIKLFEDSLDAGLNLSDEPPNHRALKVVPMPEKGGMGARAARKLQRGDQVTSTLPVGLFPCVKAGWNTPFGHSIRRQAIDHLPLETRAAVASLHGVGETEDEFVSNVIDSNMFAAKLFGDESMQFGSLVLMPSRLNHACRPNVVYYVDHETQLLHLKAIESIAKGEELTISYRALDATREARRSDLKLAYGFNCTCSHCAMSEELGKLSDQRISRILKLRVRYLYEDPSLTSQDAEELLNLCKIEKIPWCITTANIIAAEFYNSLGKMQKVKEHAEEAKNMGLILAGPSWSDLGAVEMLLSDPEKHESHFSRK
ncbi:hypothetical protein PCANC_08806 [Puccinia coronata f. sp. avenae]|uniref:SET domain-containing protein n=1 Tax=Puccinia coronata f. sp. avenae TaxID=200324 RepID=A0A2N5V8I0_9BASI|nr:hypothetical protein PCANC_08806 [Puccinia coronata f. sp. avenae]